MPQLPPIPRVQIPVMPATVATDATATGYFDCLDFDYALVVVSGPTHGTAETTTVLTLSQGTTTVVTNQTAIVAFTGGTATATNVGFVIPASTTVVTSGYKVGMLVDRRGMGRYMGIQYTPGTTDTHMMTCHALLFRGDEIPVAAADAQVDALLTQ